MIIENLEINDVRNLQHASFVPHENLNLITGHNGAGKSAVLEAIHCLSTGHSFRTRRARELINREGNSFTLTTRFRDPLTSREHRAGLQRHRDGTVQLRLDFEEIRSISDITRLLPVKALTPDSHRLIQEGPDERRQFVDWGVFHVEPQFLDSWKNFRRSLSQRNQLLRENANSREIRNWNSPFCESAQRIHHYRERYICHLTAALNRRIELIEDVFHVELRYKPGWDITNSLENLLDDNLEHHRRMKTTTEGPHRADLVVLADGVSARQYLSRGQQKLLVFLLHLSQMDLMLQNNRSQAVLLCDDLVSELDNDNTLIIINQLMDLGCQLFVSGVDLDLLKGHAHREFHMEHGGIKNVV